MEATYSIGKIVSRPQLICACLMVLVAIKVNLTFAAPLPAPHWCPVGHDLPSTPYNQDDLRKLLKILITRVIELHSHIGGIKIMLRGEVNADFSGSYPMYVDYLNIPVGSNLNSHEIADVLVHHGEDLSEIMAFLDHFIVLETSLHAALPPLFKDSHRLTADLLCEMEKLFYAETSKTFVVSSKPLPTKVQTVFQSQVNLIAFEALYHTYGTNALYLQSDLTDVLLKL